MKCMWKELLSILPPELRREVDRLGREQATELRLRLGEPPLLILGQQRRILSGFVTQDDLDFVVNTASRYSPWCSATMAQGFITAPGGHRIGLCGTAVVEQGSMQGIRSLTSLCIRVARDFPGIAKRAAELPGSVLLIGPPGSGKTTLLRDLIRWKARRQTGEIGVVDERGELFPAGLCPAVGVDVMSGCPKPQGIQRILRTMGPAWIAMDEITSQEDCEALLRAGWCGVRLLATAHAANRQELMQRSIYRKLAESRLFDSLIILRPDKSYQAERM